MVYYIAIVHKDADSAYGVSFPDIPGCFSATDDEEWLVENAVEALSLWAEDSTLPAPSSIETVRTRQDVAQELIAGAFLLAVPAPSRVAKAA